MTIGVDQGRPDSGVAYAFYSADLVDIIRRKKNQEVICFADDTTVMIRVKTVEEGVKALEETMEEAYIWSKQFNCQFAMDKFTLMGFTRKRTKDLDNPKWTKPREKPSAKINGMVIKAMTYHKFLGVMIDNELRFNYHADYTL